MLIYAVIPARSKSKRLKNKNIRNLFGAPLFLHSINFAKKLKFLDKIIFSSDSIKYFKIIKKKKNILFHLRSKQSSSNIAMEEDILTDMQKYFEENKIRKPNAILWLRPTSPLRSLPTFKKAYNLFKKEKKTVMIVHKEDSRLFKNRKKLLIPLQKKMYKKSMLRSQECEPFYSIFSGEFFMLRKKINKKFLGNKLKFVVAEKKTKCDIDTKEDFEILNNLLKSNFKYYKDFIHV